MRQYVDVDIMRQVLQGLLLTGKPSTADWQLAPYKNGVSMASLLCAGVRACVRACVCVGGGGGGGQPGTLECSG